MERGAGPPGSVEQAGMGQSTEGNGISEGLPSALDEGSECSRQRHGLAANRRQAVLFLANPYCTVIVNVTGCEAFAEVAITWIG